MQGFFGIIILPLTVIVVKLMYDEGVIGNKFLVEQEVFQKGVSEKG